MLALERDVQAAAVAGSYFETLGVLKDSLVTGFEETGKEGVAAIQGFDFDPDMAAGVKSDAGVAGGCLLL